MLGRLGAPLITSIDRPGHIFTLCFAILFLGRRSGFRAGFRPNRDTITIGFAVVLPPAGAPG